VGKKGEVLAVERALGILQGEDGIGPIRAKYLNGAKFSVPQISGRIEADAVKPKSRRRTSSALSEFTVAAGSTILIVLLRDS
jgi:hypothetical protein